MSLFVVAFIIPRDFQPGLKIFTEHLSDYVPRTERPDEPLAREWPRFHSVSAFLSEQIKPQSLKMVVKQLIARSIPRVQPVGRSATPGTLKETKKGPDEENDNLHCKHTDIFAGRDCQRCAGSGTIKRRRGQQPARNK